MFDWRKMLTGKPSAPGDKAVVGTIGQTSFVGGTFGDYSDARFHDAMQGNNGAYSSPGGIGHAPLEETQRTYANLFHATPHGRAPMPSVSDQFFPFGKDNYPVGPSVTPALSMTRAPQPFKQTVRHQPSRATVTGKA